MFATSATESRWHAACRAPGEQRKQRYDRRVGIAEGGCLHACEQVGAAERCWACDTSKATPAKAAASPPGPCAGAAHRVHRLYGAWLSRALAQRPQGCHGAGGRDVLASAGAHSRAKPGRVKAAAINSISGICGGAA